MATNTKITKDTTLADFKKLIAEDNQEAWNIVNKIMTDYKFEVVEALIDLNLRGEQIVKAYLEHNASLDCLVYWIISKYENKNI